MTGNDLDDLSTAPVDRLARALRDKEISARDLVQANLGRIDDFQSEYRAFTRVTGESALARAEELDSAATRGNFAGPLHGITLAVKDLMDVRGYPNSAGTTARRYAAPAVAHARSVSRLVDQGAIIIGLANLHEWAYGGTCANPAFGAVANPWDPTRIPGGSSGGSAVAVSLGMATIALGTDTGGSVRIPSSLSGTAGLKTTAGRVSKQGVLPLSWTLDTVGPMTRRAVDLRLPFALLAGDESAAASPVREDLRGVVVGIDRTYYADASRMDPEVTSAFNVAVRLIQDLGATVRDVSVPLLKESSAAMYAVILSEASSIHAGIFRADRSTYGADVQRLLNIGDTVLATDYLAGMRFRTMLWHQFADTFADVDVMISPTNPHAATEMGADTLTWPNGETESLLDAIWRHTYPSNLAGIPSLSQPCGLTSHGLPVGLQWIGPPQAESTLMSLAACLESQAGWTFRPPVLEGW